MSELMKAVTINEHGGREVLQIRDIAKPVARPGQVLIRVMAAGVNPADYKWRQGMFDAYSPVMFPHVIGYDVAGIVEQSDVLPAGTRVCAVLPATRKGGYAQYAVAGLERVAVIPDGMSFAQAAATISPGLTGVQLIEEHLDVQPGERVLISGATGAVGRFCVHAAKLLGATVIAAVRPAYREEALAIGADEVVVPDDQGVPETDAVADCLGGEWMNRLSRKLRPGGLIRTVATTPIPVEGLPVLPVFTVIHPDRDRLARLLAAVAAEPAKLLPPLREFPLSEVREVHRMLEEESGIGKLVLVL